MDIGEASTVDNNNAINVTNIEEGTEIPLTVEPEEPKEEETISDFDTVAKTDPTSNPDNTSSSIITTGTLFSSEGLFTYEELLMKSSAIRVSPYTTTIGSTLNTIKAREALTKYLSVTNNTLLGYEFLAGSDRDQSKYKNRLIIITGFDDDEKSLPLFDHPLIVADIKGYEYVCVDVRKYVKQLTQQPINILPESKDPGAVLFIILRGLLTVEFLEGTTGVLNNMLKTITSAYGMFLGNIVNGIIGLNPIERMNIEIVGAHFANMMFISSNDIKHSIDTVVARIANSDFTSKLNIKYVSEIVEKLDHEVKTIDGLLENIKITLNNGKEDLINMTTILGSISALWYGPGDNKTIAIGLEHAPTWIALLYSCSSDRNFKKSRLALMLDKFSRAIKPLELEKYINLYIKEHTHEEL